MNPGESGDRISPMRRIWWGLLWAGIFIVELSIFLPYLDSYFISEDFWNLAFARFTEDPLIVLTYPYYGNQFWRPLFQLLNALAWRVFGENAAGYHIITLIVHSFNTALVAVLCYLILSASDAKPGWRFMASAAAAMFFGLHPISSMTTIWFTCFEDLHGMFFLLLTLILVQRPGNLSGIIAFFTSLLALLSKETFFILPAVALIIGLIRAEKDDFSPKQKAFSAFKLALPCIAAFMCYLAWRMTVVGGIGGYEKISPSPSFLLPRLSAHLPVLFECVIEDILLYRFTPDDAYHDALLICYLLILAAAVIPVLRRRIRVLFLLCAFVLVAVAPLWNASHMLMSREERLLYQPLLGAAMIMSLLVSASGRNLVKVFQILVLAAVVYIFSSASGDALASWREQAEHNREITQTVIDEVIRLPEDSGNLRFYIVGLTREDYALDPMIKVNLDDDYLGHSFMLGEYESIVWKPTGAEAAETEKKQLPENMLPEEKGHFSNPRKYLVSYAPPDLLFAVMNDPQARIHEWRDGILMDLEKELKSLFIRRSQVQKTYSFADYEDAELGMRLPGRYLYLPSFSFYHLPMPLDWEMSPGLSVAPGHKGEPRCFVADNNDPYLVSPPTSFPALAAAAVQIEMKVEKRRYLPPQERHGAFFWQSGDEEEFRPNKSVIFEIEADGEYHKYIFDLGRSIAWCRSGTVTGLRLDPISFSGSFWLRRIEFLPANWEEFRD